MQHKRIFLFYDREDQSCGCPYGECGKIDECPHGDYFNCGNRNCKPGSYKCNSDNDCGDWKDEPDSCRIKDYHIITLTGNNASSLQLKYGHQD